MKMNQTYHLPQSEVEGAELQRLWEARVAQGSFSPGVACVGTIRVMGQSGDTPLTYPVITSLAVLDSLAPEERWAFNVGQGAVTQALERNRTVVALEPGQPQPDALTAFDPSRANVLILSMTSGG